MLAKAVGVPSLRLEPIFSLTNFPPMGRPEQLAQFFDRLRTTCEIYYNRSMSTWDSFQAVEFGDIKGEVEELVREYLDLFIDQETAVGHMDPEFYHEFCIRLEHRAVPIRQGFRPLHFQHKESLKAQLASWLRDGVIQPGHSPWGSALVPVLKK